jgi:class 3 adenylate cyclase
VTCCSRCESELAFISARPLSARWDHRGSQIISAIGETTNACSRLEGLTKQYDCRVIVSRRAAETAGLDVGNLRLHWASVNDLAQPVEFYTLNSLADLRV